MQSSSIPNKKKRVFDSHLELEMASLWFICCLMTTLLSCSQSKAFLGSGFGRGNGGYLGLTPGFYEFSCPQANEIIMSVLENAIAKDSRMAASLLRLHFHDCFVQVQYC